MKKLFLLLFLSLLTSCGTSVKSETFGEPILTAVDSTNDRLFVIEKERKFFIYTASTRSGIGDQPVVKNKRLPDLYDILPTSPTNMAVMDMGGGVSRIFLTGAQANTDGNLVTNQILVLDFDGTTLSESAISPITVTGNTTDIIGGLAVDSANDRIFATNTSSTTLYAYSASTGAETTLAVIAGTPNKMGLDGTHLYIANSASTDADQVITVLDTGTLATTTIDLDIPTDDIAVVSNANGTVMLAKEAGVQTVLVQEVDTTTYAAATDIPAGNATTVAGEINTGNGGANGVTGSIGGVLLTKNADGVIYGYAPQSDGNINLMTILSDLSSFTQSNIPTSTDGLEGLDVYSGTDGTGITVYMAASVSGDLVWTSAGSDQASARF